MIIKLDNGSGKEVSRGDRDGMQRKNMCAGREVRCRGADQQSSISEKRSEDLATAEFGGVNSTD